MLQQVGLGHVLARVGGASCFSRGVQPNTRGEEASVDAGCSGGALPGDWEVPDCEMYAILKTLRRVADTIDPTGERDPPRVALCVDCESVLLKIAPNTRT